MEMTQESLSVASDFPRTILLSIYITIGSDLNSQGLKSQDLKSQEVKYINVGSFTKKSLKLLKD